MTKEEFWEQVNEMYPPGSMLNAHPDLEMSEGYFKDTYELSGRDWLASLPAEEREAFGKYGAQFGASKAGKARAAQADRCTMGHMLAKDGSPCKACANAPAGYGMSDDWEYWSQRR